MNEYKTILNEEQDEVVIKKSHFIGYAKPVTTAEEAMEFVQKIKKQNYNATHNCFAYMLKDRITKRCSDDGEPQGTAGIPMLDVITKEEIVDCVVVVTRYFGGTLLGTGGLVRAYSQGTKIALEKAKIVTMTSCTTGKITCDYNFYGKVLPFIAQNSAIVVDTEFKDDVDVIVKMQTKDYNQFCEKLVDFSNGKVLCETTFEEFCVWE